MARHKAQRAQLGLIPGDGQMYAPSRNRPYTLWFIRHPAAYVHAGIHCVLLALVFGWLAIVLAIVHLAIDTRVPVVAWSKLIRQTQPERNLVRTINFVDEVETVVPSYDIGTEVRFWTDQVFHIACIAVAAIVVTL